MFTIGRYAWYAHADQRKRGRAVYAVRDMYIVVHFSINTLLTSRYDQDPVDSLDRAATH